MKKLIVILLVAATGGAVIRTKSGHLMTDVQQFIRHVKFVAVGLFALLLFSLFACAAPKQMAPQGTIITPLAEIESEAESDEISVDDWLPAPTPVHNGTFGQKAKKLPDGPSVQYDPVDGVQPVHQSPELELELEPELQLEPEPEPKPQPEKDDELEEEEEVDNCEDPDNAYWDPECWDYLV